MSPTLSDAKPGLTPRPNAVEPVPGTLNVNSSLRQPSATALARAVTASKPIARNTSGPFSVSATSKLTRNPGRSVQPMKPGGAPSAVRKAALKVYVSPRATSAACCGLAHATGSTLSTLQIAGSHPCAERRTVVTPSAFHCVRSLRSSVQTRMFLADRSAPTTA